MAKGLQGIVWFVSSLWIVYLSDAILPVDFNSYGLTPRTLHGLFGIPLMPFLHGSFQHLMSNTIPLCILLFILHGARRDVLRVTVSIVLLGGLLLWCFGRSRIHIGASGLVYGLVAFLIANGFAERKLVSVFVALVVGFLYGTTLFLECCQQRAGRYLGKVIYSARSQEYALRSHWHINRFLKHRKKKKRRIPGNDSPVLERIHSGNESRQSEDR